MRRSVALAILIVLANSLFAANPVKVMAEYVYYAPESVSVEEAKRVAVERAKIQALEDNFGTKVAQATSTMITSDNEKSNTRFSLHGMSDVRGEWLETIGEPDMEVSFQEHNIVIRCRITGLAKEISGTKIEYEAFILRNVPDLNFKSTTFVNGDDMYLYFKSPVDGFLNVFLLSDNDNQAYCLLPYKKGKGTFFVSADTPYFLFTKNKAGSDAEIVDEYTLTAESEVEYNEIVIVFSPEEFHKTGLHNTANTVPKMTTLSAFNEWLSKLRAKNDHITMTTIPLTIKNHD